MVIIRISGIFYIITPSYMFRLSLFEPSSDWSIMYNIILQSGSNNVKYTINPNNNH